MYSPIYSIKYNLQICFYFLQIKNPSVFVDELPPDQLLADDQNNLDGSGNEYFGDSSSADPNQDQSIEEEDFDIDIDIKEEDFENIPYIGGKIVS